MQTTVTITTRTRNLGYGWSTDHAVSEPNHVGTVRTVRRAMVERARLIGHGTHYTDRLFVGGVAVADRPFGIHEILNEVETSGDVVVELNPALRAAEIAAILGVSRQTVLARFHAGELSGAWRTGNRGEVRMYRDDVLALLG